MTKNVQTFVARLVYLSLMLSFSVNVCFAESQGDSWLDVEAQAQVEEFSPSIASASGPQSCRYNPKVEVDLSSFNGNDLRGLGICEDPYQEDFITATGFQIKMLGAAFVYMGPSNGKSVFGHVGERFVYCRGKVLNDVVFSYAQVERKDVEAKLQQDFNLDPKTYTDQEKDRFSKSLVLERTFDPAVRYGENQVFKNRNIYEVWFNVDSETQYQMLLTNTQRYLKQIDQLLHHKSLPKYHVFSNNCTGPVKKDLQLIDPGFLTKFAPARALPTFLYSAAKSRCVDRVVIYPSQRMFRIMRMKEKNQSVWQEKIVPLSKASPEGVESVWMLFYPEFNSRWQQTLFTPVAGAANLAVATAETAFGVLTVPTNLLSHVPGLKWLRNKHGGWKRVQRGFWDMTFSAGEMIWIRARYPKATQWTAEERIFFRDSAQVSLMANYIRGQL